jgi:hypothetical protein
MSELINPAQPAKLTPAQRIAQWLYLDPKLSPTAYKIANGDDYSYGDDELAAWVDTLLYDGGPGKIDFLWVGHYNASVSAAANLRDHMRRSTFDTIEWAAVRTALLAYKES